MNNLELEQFEKDKVIIDISKITQELAQRVDSLEINSDETQKEAIELLNPIKENINYIEERKKFFTDPLNKILKLINSKAKELIQPLEDIQRKTKLKLNDYQYKLLEEKRKLEEKMQKKVEKAIENNKPIPIIPSVKVDNTIKTTSNQITFKDNWKAEIMDPKIFIEYCIKNNMTELLEINESKLNQYAKMVKDTKTLPGIKIWNDRIISQKNFRVA